MIRTYIDRYLAGESTQEELRLIREYLHSTPELPADLVPLARMFECIEEKQTVPSTEALDKLSNSLTYSLTPGPSPRRGEKVTTWRWFMLAAACLAAVALIISVPRLSPDDKSLAVAYVDGRELSDGQLAMQMGFEALQDIFAAGENQEQQLTTLFNNP